MARTVAGIRPERGNRAFLVLAVMAALVAAVLVFAALNRGGEGGTSSAVKVSVVVASQDIPAGTRLTAEKLKVAAMEPDAQLQGTVADVPALLGRVTRYPIATGEQITLTKIGLEEKNKEGLSFIIPAGQRAMAVSVTQVTSVGGLLLPGDKVDVIVVFNANQGASERAVTLFQNIEVLAVAQVAQEPVPPPQSTQEGEATGGQQPLAQRPQDAQPQPEATTVTLALTPDQAQLLALAHERGKVWLTLRPFGEGSAVELGSSTLNPFITP